MGCLLLKLFHDKIEKIITNFETPGCFATWGFLIYGYMAQLDTHCKGSKGLKKKEKKKRKVSDRKHLRKVERPEYNVLLAEVNSIGYSATGRKYGVSDNAVRKWLKI